MPRGVSLRGCMASSGTAPSVIWTSRSRISATGCVRHRLAHWLFRQPTHGCLRRASVKQAPGMRSTAIPRAASSARAPPFVARQTHLRRKRGGRSPRPHASALRWNFGIGSGLGVAGWPIKAQMLRLTGEARFRSRPLTERHSGFRSPIRDPRVWMVPCALAELDNASSVRVLSIRTPAVAGCCRFLRSNL
jgi:hypothetical protein